MNAEDIENGGSYNAIVKIKETIKFPWLLIFAAFFLVCFFIGWRLNAANNLNVILAYTYEFPSSQPGELTSQRFNSWFWSETVADNMRVVFMCASVARIALYRTPSALYAHVLLSVLYLIAEVANVVIIALEIRDCNEEPSTQNMCTSFKYCGVPEFAGNTTECPRNFCPLETDGSVNVSAFEIIPWFPDPLTPDDLTWRDTFTFTLSLAIILLALAILVMLFSFMTSSPVVVEMEPYQIGGKDNQQQQPLYNSDPSEYGNIQDSDGGSNTFDLSQAVYNVKQRSGMSQPKGHSRF